MLTLFSVGRGSGGGSDLSTGAVAAISAGIVVAIILSVILFIVCLCKLLLEVIKKKWNNISVPNAGLCLGLNPITCLISCWRISKHLEKCKDRRRLKRDIRREIEDPEAKQVCL